MKQMSLKKNALYSVLKAFLSLVFPIITFPYASRILKPEGIGRVNFANSVVSYFVLLSTLGIGGYACRELSKIKNDEIKTAKFVKEIFLINSVSTIVGYILFFLAYIFIPKLYDYRSLLLICSIKILFTTFGVDWIYNAYEEFKYKTVRSFAFQVLGLVFLFLCVHSSENVIQYAIFGLISSVGSNLFNLIHSRKFIKYSIKVKLNPKPHVKPVFVFWGMALVTSIYTTLDTTMLGFLSNDKQVGFYSAATKISHMVLSMLTAISTVLMPRLSKLIADGKIDSFKELAKKSFNIVFIISTPMSVGLCLLSKPLTLLLSGESYLPAVLPMMVITPIVLFIPLGSVMGGQVLPSIGKEKISLYSYMLGAILNGFLNFTLIPKYGAVGAALGTLAAEGSISLFQFVYLRKYLICKLTLINVVQVLLSVFIMFVSVYFIINFFDNKLMQLFLGTIFGALVYAISLLGVRNKIILEYVGKILHKQRNIL